MLFSTASAAYPLAIYFIVTGASRGLGRSITEVVLKNGDIAVAAVRDPSSLSALSSEYPSTQLLVVSLDVSRAEDVKAAFATTLKAFDRIDVVFNNAAIFHLGEAEATPDDEARKLFEINFWGAANVSLEAVKTFREVNKPQGGRLINISSATGFAPIPGGAYYVASKFGLEGFTDVLRQELDPSWNIKVCIHTITLESYLTLLLKITIVEPGGYATGWQAGVKEFASPPAYEGAHMPAVIARGMLKATSAGDPYKAAQVLYFKLAREDNPPTKLPLGLDSQYLVGNKLTELGKEIESYKSWSVGLTTADPPLEL